MTQKGRVLVTDGNERAALAVTRALGKQGIEVLVGAATFRSLAGASRYCLKQVQYPSPDTHPGDYIDRLREIVAQEAIGVLIPVSDITMQLVGGARSQFDRLTRIPIPPQLAYEAVSDKYRLMQVAQRLDVPIPDTIFVPNGEVPAKLDEVGAFPLIVKPGKSRVQIGGRCVGTTVRQVGNVEELRTLYRATEYLKQPSLIQRRIEGEGQGIFALFDKGTPLALFAHRRIREKPPAGGVSVLRESIPVPKIMAEYALRLLSEVGWHGVAMVEFKVDRITGVPRLMEINGRFWGSLQLSLDSGLNFPLLLLRLAEGEDLRGETASYRTGVRSRWLLGDLDHLLARVLHSNEKLGLPEWYPSRMRCILEFCQFFKSNEICEVERWDDFSPALYEVTQYFRNLIGGRA